MLKRTHPSQVFLDLDIVPRAGSAHLSRHAPLSPVTPKALWGWGILEMLKILIEMCWGMKYTLDFEDSV